MSLRDQKLTEGNPIIHIKKKNTDIITVVHIIIITTYQFVE